MKIVFFGTSVFAARILESLLKQGVNVTAVVTRVDKPQGRNLNLLPPPVKSFLQNEHPQIPLYQPIKASTPEFEAVLKALNPDIFVVVAYGEIIKKNILNIPPFGCINIHPSLLPLYRGAAPIHHALLNGDEKTGVCIIEMVEAMDAGDILAKEIIDISPEDNFESLESKLLILAQKLVLKVLHDKEKNSVQKEAQDHSKMILAPKITAEMERINWNNTASKNYNIIRALSPRPGAWCKIKIGQEEKRLKIIFAKAHKNFNGNPSEVLVQTKDSLIVACSEGALEILEVQPEGKKRLPIKDFLNGISKTISFLATN